MSWNDTVGRIGGPRSLLTPRGYLPVAVVLVMALVVSACGPSSTGETTVPTAPGTAAPTTAAAGPATACRPDQPRTIRLGNPAPGLALALYYATVAGDYFKKYGITIKELDIGGGNIPALLAGDIDVAMTAFSQVFALRNQGRPVKAFGSLASEHTSHIVLATALWEKAGLSEDSDWETRARALRGLVIGSSTPGAGIDNALVAILRAAGMDPERDVQRIAFEGGGPMLAAFQQGRVAAFAWAAPATTQPLVDGSGKMLFNLAKGDFPPIHNFQHAAFVATERWLADSEEDAGCMLVALADGAALLQNEEDRAKALMRPLLGFMKVSDEVWDQAWKDSYYFIGKVHPRIDPEAAATAWTVDNEARGVKNPVEDHYVNSIADKYLGP